MTPSHGKVYGGLLVIEVECRWQTIAFSLHFILQLLVPSRGGLHLLTRVFRKGSTGFPNGLRDRIVEALYVVLVTHRV